MIQGLYAAASGMTAIEEQQGVIANNIANAATPGFKRQNIIQEGFYGILQGEMRDAAAFNGQTAPGGGVHVAGVYSDWNEGTIASTGDPMNIALVGPGFLTVETDGGDRYTRGGRFQVDPDGYLATSEGQKILGAGGMPIRVDGARVEFDEMGNVYADGSNVGRLELVEFAEPRMLSREGDGLFAAPTGAAFDVAQNTRVVSQALELSNVQLPYEMAQMMAGLRAYGAYQRMINTADETLGRLIDQVAMPV